MKTTAEVIAWIMAHTDNKTEKAAEEAAVWFMAMIIAEELMEMDSTKELARWLLPGVPAVTLDDLQDWLDDQWTEDKSDCDPESDDYFSAAELIEGTFEDFFKGVE